jgi:OmpA-OmpF porin, OOP family
MRRALGRIVALLVALLLSAGAQPAHAQFGKLKEKVKQKVEQQVGKAADKKDEAAADSSGAKPAAPAGGSAAAQDMTLYTKYDFVPGDKVIFYDDLASEEIGEFPSRWALDQGVFEIARQGGRNYILCTDKGSIRPRIPAGPLPVKYTIELACWAKGPEAQGHWFGIEWLDGEGQTIGRFELTDNVHTHLRADGRDLASKDLPAPVAAGLHTLRVMATRTSLKCYVDQERVANVPALEGFAPVGLRVTMDPWVDKPDNPMLIGDFRYAEGGKTMKEQLDETGRIVTHGILFDSGSAQIRAESYKTLADIGQLLTDSPALRLSIEGHTDSDGAEDANLTLSQNRAAAVKTYLGATYKIDGARLETKGWGEAKPIAPNDTPEGKAMNRRVELVKL